MNYDTKVKLIKIQSSLVKLLTRMIEVVRLRRSFVTYRDKAYLKKGIPAAIHHRWRWFWQRKENVLPVQLMKEQKGKHY